MLWCWIIRWSPRRPVALATSRPGVRRLVLSPYPYVVFYRVAATEIVILRFRHTARKPLPDG
ncbi:type II toxin-antitoxin system RelE/ParE family toxin [Aurantimonas sp. CSK15Z-1]|nr:type II toxin-antitoxin system RelE/ParE family toxin [Aurantimonas sp. CSK15Z-1]